MKRAKKRINFVSRFMETKQSLYGSFVFITIALVWIIWFGVVLTEDSSKLNSAADRFQASAMEFRIESTQLTASSTITVDQSSLAFTNSSYFNELITNKALLANELNIMKQALSETNTSEGLIKGADAADSVAAQYRSDAEKSQNFGLMTTTFGSLLIGVVLSWAFNNFLITYPRKEEMPSKKRTKKRQPFS